MRAALDKNTGILSAMLVDYGVAHRAKLEPTVVKPNGMILGKNAGTMDVVEFLPDEKESEFKVITRGWMNVQNRSNNYNKEVVIEGEEYEFDLELQPIDYTILKGHKLGFIIYSTDAEATQRPFLKTKFTIDTSSIKLEIPVVGGKIK